MNFMEDFVKYMAFQAHTNPWCKQEHMLTPLRMKYLMAIAIGMQEGDINIIHRELANTGREYMDLKIVFFGSEDVCFWNLRLDDGGITDMPKKYNPRTSILNAANREWIRDTLHVFRGWDTGALYSLLRDVLPGKAFSNTKAINGLTPCVTTAVNLADAFSNLMYVYRVDETGYEHAEPALRNQGTVVEPESVTPGPVIEINMPKQCDGPCDRKTFWVRSEETNKKDK